MLPSKKELIAVTVFGRKYDKNFANKYKNTNFVTKNPSLLSKCSFEA